MTFHPVEYSHLIEIDKSPKPGYKRGIEFDAPNRISVELLAGLLLEMAQERSLEQLLQEGVRRALELPAALIAVVWLIDRGKDHRAGLEKDCRYENPNNALF